MPLVSFMSISIAENKAQWKELTDLSCARSETAWVAAISRRIKDRVNLVR